MNFIPHFFGYNFGGEESRPWDLQAWTVEGGIPSQARSQLGRNSASRGSNFMSCDKKRIRERAQKIQLHRFAPDFGVEKSDSALVTKAKFQKDHDRNRCADGKDSGIAEVKLSREQLSMILAGNHGFSWATFQKSAVAVVNEFGMAEGNFTTDNTRSKLEKFATKM